MNNIIQHTLWHASLGPNEKLSRAESDVCAKIWRAAVGRYGAERCPPVAMLPSQACQSRLMTQTNEQHHSASYGTHPWGPMKNCPARKAMFAPKSGARPWCGMV